MGAPAGGQAAAVAEAVRICRQALAEPPRLIAPGMTVPSPAQVLAARVLAALGERAEPGEETRSGS